jgi:WD40 repeat protein
MSLQYDKDRIVTGSADNTIKVWDPVTGKCLVRILYYCARARARAELIGVGLCRGHTGDAAGPYWPCVVAPVRGQSVGLGS